MTTISPNDLDQDAQSLNTVVPTIRLKSVNTNRKTIAMLGTGAWGSALATLAAVNDHDLRLWSRRGELSLEEAIADADIIISAISMKGVSDVAEQLKAISLPAKAIIVTATKGLDPKTTRTPSQIWQETFPDHPVVVLSGPNLSKEIEAGLPAATVVASTDLEAAETVQEVFASDCFRVYTNNDPLGTELGGTLKNVMAIAVGVCEGLKLGTNAKSALITRALPEMIRVGAHLGAQPETFLGLAGLGDMLATCTSPLSRNYRVGYGLAQGKSLEQILEELGSTAEGVNTTAVLLDLANREEIPIPISRQVYRLLKGKITPMEAVTMLMERDLKPEACDLLE
ncbi:MULTISPECIES: NAD(P)H-dependent glycerol-3-phosphate dehydrogenase [Cyanophyceae]|nr:MULTISPECIES: NAD(P)H-dependent glycerol-3-phosphate dehydrogenase [Cyanophyceae]ACB00821.1 NAD+ dependent glycerol-3-phosphate dehydrogenase [Picosynechococcus sp. PCC 7002]AMA10378.1 glycerol-3-phosphate dehydrogenase [Picosynechococcus sp. PCC 73109]ANV88571.1 glycerol-3-phosphate dehydrogenase [Picosynechococcus sp. PCC 7117]ANV91727.1 glycerol-3-phosphate dehydrogenase [Picosynechococcus sp. PCC 8807]QCS48646.1 NAD(P)H-dependent glycerol-3-phosphate dehydrogenase [Picosynechococcus sp.